MAMLIDRRYNPFRDFEDIDRSFFGDNSLAEFKTDIRDIGDAYVMECDLPGFRKEDIALNLHDKVLTIKAERHSDFENAEKKGSYLRCERSFGSYTRSFDVTGVDTTKVRAAYNNDEKRLWPGEPGDCLDHKRYADTLKKIGFEGDVCTMEVFRPDYYKLSNEENIKKAAEVTKAHVAKYWAD